MFCTTIVLYGVFAGVILGITDGQAERLDQHCRNLMTGRRFGFYVPFHVNITVEFTLYSDTSGTLVQFTDDSGTVNYRIPEEGVRSFNRVNYETEGILIISNADIGVSVRSLNFIFIFDMRLLCVPEGLSQHFMSDYFSSFAIMSLEDDNGVRYNLNGGDYVTRRLQQREVLHLGGNFHFNVVCSGTCAVYEFSTAVQNYRTCRVIPIQFYPSDYFIKFSPLDTFYGSAVQIGATANLTTELRDIQTPQHDRYYWISFDVLYESGYVRCSSGCVAGVKYFPEQNRFFSPPESTDGSLIRSTGNTLMIVFDYGITERRTFEEVYSLGSISPSGSNQMTISRTEFVNNINDVYKYVFVEATSGVYRISSISDIGSSAIYVQDVPNEETFTIPLYYTSYPSKTVDVCQRPIKVCGSGEVCVNEPENFTYSCVQEINECASNPCMNNGTCTDTLYLFNCSCALGFMGSTCEENIDDCETNRCLNSGTCVDGVNSFTCQCIEGYENGALGTCEIESDECASSPCQNSGSCINEIARFFCSCMEGFTGVVCETNIDDCETNGCLNSGTCVDGVNSFTCQCIEGYENGALGTCEIDIDECASSPCQNSVSCINEIARFFCSCMEGFTGAVCETNIDDCETNRCLNNGTCVDGVNSFSCQCVGGFENGGLGTCEIESDECASSPCQNSVSCIDEVAKFFCSCMEGFTGAVCETNIDDCETNKCLNNGTCVDGVNSFTCQCVEGFENGDLGTCEIDIDDCETNRCLNDGTCMDGVNSFTCQCVEGFENGDLGTCEIEPDECASSPCQNSGSCRDDIARFFCSCMEGFTGVVCETNIDDCETNRCLNSGTCVDGVNSFICQCSAGYENGDLGTCEIESDECASSPCQNSVSCIDDTARFFCSCMEGFTGAVCETNIDDCETNRCLNNGTCVDGVNSFICQCVEGYENGALGTCEIEINECDSNPCLNGASCTDGVNLFNCSCVKGFTGYSCEEDINECDSNPCLNGGNCTDGVNLFNCSCVEGFTGYSCEEDIDDCETNRCLNNGTCVDGVNSFTCQCVKGFENGALGTCEIVLGECTDSPCLNGGACVSVGDSFSCNCTQGFVNGVLGICEVVEEAVPGYSRWREGEYKECTYLQTSTYNVTNIQECGIKCSENAESCSAFVFGPDERCTLTKAICENQNTSGDLYFRKGIEFVRLSTFSFEVFMNKIDAENSKHHFIGLKIEKIGDYTKERDAELRSLLESKQDTLVELLYQSQFVIDVNLDHLESGSVVAVYDVLVDNIDGATLLDHVSNTLAEFRNSSGFQIDEISLLDYTTDGCSKLSDFCLNGGTCVYAPEGDVYCQCPAAFNGDKCQNPVVNVTSIFPIRGSGPFGPESGGTRITMMGSHLNLSGPPVVDLGGYVCPLNSSSHVSIVCQTARAIRPEAIGTELSITLSWPPQDHPLPQGKLETVYSFVYLKDPNISTVFPLKTIAAGGVDLSITGENMDSVAVPVMEMFALTGATVLNVFYKDCDLRSSTLFVCPTANLNLTEANVRPKQEAEPRKRYTYNGEEVEIEINFFLDGVQEFRNMSEARPEYSTIVVFIDPQIEPSTEVETFRPFWPFGDEFLTRTGFNLLDGLEESQYRAFVGMDQCTEVIVHSNSISCRAPRSEPEKSNEFYDHPELVIVVDRGYLSFQCGSINYQKHLLEYRPVQIATGVAVFLVILVVGVTILCCRYKRKILTNRPNSTVDGAEPNDTLTSKLDKTTTETEPLTGEENIYEQIGYEEPATNQTSAGGYENWYPSDYEEVLSRPEPPQPIIRDTSEYTRGATIPTMLNTPHACDNNTPGNYQNMQPRTPDTGSNPGYTTITRRNSH